MSEFDVPRSNRVDPWGDLYAVSSRGMFTGNRGCLVDDTGEIVRHHRGSLWITCVTQFRGWRFPLAAPGRWTPLFFLDDAVALAAGHRPGGLCRRDSYRSYRDAVSSATASRVPLSSIELNRRLAAERHQRGRGLVRADDRLLWTTSIDNLPIGTVVLAGDRHPYLVLDRRLRSFSFDGWGSPVERPHHVEVDVLTPPTSVAALANGFVPTLHDSVRR